MAKEKGFLWFTSSLAYITHCVPRSQLLKKPRYLEFIFPAYRVPRSQLHKIHRHLDFIYICAYRVARSQPFSLTHSMWRGIWVFWSYSLFSPKSVGKNGDSTGDRVKRALKANDSCVVSHVAWWETCFHIYFKVLLLVLWEQQKHAVWLKTHTK